MYTHLTEQKDANNYILFAHKEDIMTHETFETACSVYVEAMRLEKAGWKVVVILVNACAHSANKVGIYIYKKPLCDMKALAIEELHSFDAKEGNVS